MVIKRKVQTLPMKTDERFFSYYDRPSERVPHQVKLFKKLENLGYEKSGKHILSDENLGVPVTIMLLLMRDALDHIKEEDTNSVNAFHELGTYTLDEMYQFMGLAESDLIIPAGQSLPGSWDINQFYDIVPEANISGSTVAIECYAALPNQSQTSQSGLSISTNRADVIVTRDSVKAIKSNGRKIPIITVFKYVYEFIEFAYAISERLHKREKKIFKELFTDSFTNLPEQPVHFKRACSMRGAIMHGGSLNINFSDLTGKLVIKDEEMVEFFTKILDNACMWLEDCYKMMSSSIDA